jgi:hypothetical protein
MLAGEFQAELRSPEKSLRDIAAILGRDPARGGLYFGRGTRYGETARHFGADGEGVDAIEGGGKFGGGAVPAVVAAVLSEKTGAHEYHTPILP